MEIKFNSFIVLSGKYYLNIKMSVNTLQKKKSFIMKMGWLYDRYDIYEFDGNKLVV